MRRFLWLLFLAGLSVTIGYFGYDAYVRYLAFRVEIEADARRAAETQANAARLRDALQAAGIDLEQLARGFWYTYTDSSGGQSVQYFDLGRWALREGLSEAEIQALATQIAGAERVDRDAMRVVPEAELPPTLRFHNRLYSATAPGAFDDIQQALEAVYKSGKASSEDLWQLAYLYELRGEYAMRDAVNEENCERFGERCLIEARVTLTGDVRDLAGNPVQGAHVSVLSQPEHPGADTNERGTFTLTISAKTMEKIRISAVKRNYSSGVASVIVITPGKKAYRVDPIVLGTPMKVVTIDTTKHTVTDPQSQARPDGSFVLRGEYSIYEIAPNSIVRADGTPYHGVIDVYIYEFTRETVPESLVTLDTFDEVMGYAGDLMRTYGMPYIQFFAQSGEQLDVRAEKPMLLTYRVPHMQEMRENADKALPRAFTDADMETLLAVSQGNPRFPITAEFLFANNIPSYPPFWVLDRKSGVWDNVGVRMLDSAGTIQAPFYTSK